MLKTREFYECTLAIQQIYTTNMAANIAANTAINAKNNPWQALH